MIRLHQKDGLLGWQREAIRLRFTEQNTVSDVLKLLRKSFPQEFEGLYQGKAYDKVRCTLRGYERTLRRKGVLVDKPIEKPKELKEQKPHKVEVVQNLEPTVTESFWKNERIIKFGIVSDTHINSKWTQLTHLNDFYQRAKAEGVTNIYNAGDIDEGEQMRPGHQYECYTQGADDHVDEIIRVYPQIEGITTHFITGN